MIGRNKPSAGTASSTPSIQWANGKTLARPFGGNARFAPHVGFHIQVGKFNEIDGVLENVDFPKIEIKHQRQGGSEVVLHWSFGEGIWFLPITSGPVGQTIGACMGRLTEMAESGIGLSWPENDKSHLAVRGFEKNLWGLGYKGVVQFGAKSRMTDHLLIALLDHTRIAELAEAMAQEKRPDAMVSPADIWMSLGPGEEQEFGRGDTATVVPVASLHPEKPDQLYLRRIWRSNDVAAAALKEWRGVQEWAGSFAGRGEYDHLNEQTGELTTRSL